MSKKYTTTTTFCDGVVVTTEHEKMSHASRRYIKDTAFGVEGGEVTSTNDDGQEETAHVTHVNLTVMNTETGEKVHDLNSEEFSCEHTKKEEASP